MDIDGPMGLRDQLNLTYVPRWTIVPMARHQSVAEHSWRVAMVATDLGWRLNKPVLAKAVALMALSHDLDEVYTADVPSSAKPPHPLPQSQEAVILKLADLLEAFHWVRMWGVGPRVPTIASRIRTQVDSLIVWASSTDMFNQIDLELAVQAVDAQMEGV